MKKTTSKIMALALSAFLLISASSAYVSAVEKVADKPAAKKINAASLLLNENINYVHAENLLEIGVDEANPKSDKGAVYAAAVNSGTYGYVNDYLTYAGQQKYYTIELGEQELLHVQVDMPNVSTIDYDVYLFEINPANGNIIQTADACEYVTNTNNGTGTLSEAVGVYNRGSVNKLYAIFVVSCAGFSTTSPYTLHYAVNSRKDSLEADENVTNYANIAKQLSIGLNGSSATRAVILTREI